MYAVWNHQCLFIGSFPQISAGYLDHMRNGHASLSLRISFPRRWKGADSAAGPLFCHALSFKRPALSPCGSGSSDGAAKAAVFRSADKFKCLFNELFMDLYLLYLGLLEFFPNRFEMKEVKALINLLKTERYYFLHNRTYWWSVIMIFMLGFITAPAYRSEIFGPKEKIAENLTDILNGMVYDSTFLLIIVSCILALVLGQEFSWRTIQQEIAAGHSRLTVFISKIIVYLTAFNLLALVFPAAGCIRESIYFGIHYLIGFLSDFVRAAADSFLFNSPVLLIPIFLCFVLRNMPRAICAAALLTFVLSLYLGYGMMLDLPVRFLPSFQIRQVISGTEILTFGSLAVSLCWSTVLLLASWKTFRSCELK